MRAPSPSLDLYQKVKAGFVLQGKSLKAWCRENGTNLPNARASLIGTWNGPAGKEMRARIVTAAKLGELQAQMRALA